jgi:hypothetical protein
VQHWLFAVQDLLEGSSILPPVVQLGNSRELNPQIPVPDVCAWTGFDQNRKNEKRANTKIKNLFIIA